MIIYCGKNFVISVKLIPQTEYFLDSEQKSLRVGLNSALILS